MQNRGPKEIRLKGAPVSEGIAIGKPYFLRPLEDDIPDFEIATHEVDQEVARYRKAIFSSKEDLTKIRQDLANEGSDEAVSAIESHIQMLDDPLITTDIEGKIRENLRNTESVFRTTIFDYESRFQERSDSFFHERLIDVKDVSTRILGHLRDKQDAQLCGVPAQSIVLTPEVVPSVAAAAHAAQVSAFITLDGGGNSHAALITRSKGIPYVADIDIEYVEEKDPELIIVDGYTGDIILDPTDATIAKYREQQAKVATRYQFLLEQDPLPVKTQDGRKIKVFINVGNPHDMNAYPYEHCGVGLFRTEYLFLQTQDFYPTEAYQEKAYRKLIEKMGNRPVVIRAFDLGGDKSPSLIFGKKSEPNPALGNRGIRFLFKDPKLFKGQLRAIFRASVGADVRILLPLIADVTELERAKEIIFDVRESLLKDYPDIPDLPIGCMVEVPSAVVLCEALAEKCDFLSIGTNDLVQYTLAADRGNPSMRDLYFPGHPSVLRMIKMVCSAAKKSKTPVSVCGEIASNILFTPLLIGLGIKEISLAPRFVPHVKQAIRDWKYEDAKKLVDQALALSDASEVLKLLHRD